jgi:hypothetical protein
MRHVSVGVLDRKEVGSRRREEGDRVAGHRIGVS